jgi:phosphopantothenoylcysteine decarboxylase/phosphopantothenate--cysteine ligase
MEESKKSTLAHEILICVTGSISAVNVPTIIRYILDRHVAAGVSVALTQNARRFVSETTLAIVTQRPCLVDMFEAATKGEATHVALANRCDLAVVVPATANIIGKLANGIVDDTVTSVLSVCDKPTIIVPAIHPIALQKKTISRNIERLQEDGYDFLGPVHGLSVSEGKRGLGLGAMPEPEVIVAYIERAIGRHSSKEQ